MPAHHKRDLCACGGPKMAHAQRCRTCTNKARAKGRPADPVADLVARIPTMPARQRKQAQLKLLRLVYERRGAQA